VYGTTEAAVFAAAFHDRHEGARALHARGRQMIELLDFGKGDVHLRAQRAAARVDHAGQAVQGLRAEHQVHERRALGDGGALLAGHATAYTDQQMRVVLLEMAHAPQVREHFLLRLLAHRAGVEQDEIGLARIVRRLHALSRAQ
jgi:hypothetical protein